MYDAGTNTQMKKSNNLPTLTADGSSDTWGTQVTYSNGDSHIFIGTYPIEIYAEFDSPYTQVNSRSP